jgi:hypothetical protein
LRLRKTSVPELAGGCLQLERQREELARYPLLLRDEKAVGVESTTGSWPSPLPETESSPRAGSFGESQICSSR